MSTIQLSGPFRRDIRGSGDKMSHFCEAVYTYEDRIIAFRGWQFDDEIHGDGLPGPSGDGERLVSPERSVTRDFVSPTGVASIDVFIGELSHPRPVIVSRQ